MRKVLGIIFGAMILLSGLGLISPIATSEGGSEDITFVRSSSWEFFTIGAVGSLSTSMKIDNAGCLHVAFGDDNGTLTYAFGRDGNWRMEKVDTHCWYPSLALDVDGNPHISYGDWINRTLKYATKKNGMWNLECVDPDSRNGTGWSTSIVIDSYSYPHIFYEDIEYGYLRYARWDGISWNLNIIDNSSRANFISSDIDKNNNIHVGYQSSSDDSVRYARMVSTSWEISVIETGGPDSGLFGASLMRISNVNLKLDNDLRPQMIYSYQKTLKYAKYLNDNWQIESIATMEDGGYTGVSLTIDQDNRLHIAFCENIDTYVSNLKYAYLSHGEWYIHAVDYGELYESSITVDSNYQIHIVYSDWKPDPNKLILTTSLNPVEEYTNGTPFTNEEINIAVVMADYTDEVYNPNPSFDYNHYLTNIVNPLNDYYEKNSYGSVSFNFSFYPNNDGKGWNGNWYTVPRNQTYYGKDSVISFGVPPDRSKEFLQDAVDIVENDISSSLANIYETVIVVHPGWSQQLVGNTNLLYAYVEIHDYPLPMVNGISSMDGTKIKNTICVGEEDWMGLWAHEIGHALGNVLVDRTLPDRYKNGQLGYWDLMALGAYTQDSNWDSRPVHMSSFSKIWLDWLESINAEKGTTYTIKSLSDLEYGEDVLRLDSAWLPDALINQYFLFEGRYTDEDNWEIVPENGVVIYSVHTPIGWGEVVDIVYDSNDLTTKDLPYWSDTSLDRKLNHATLRNIGDEYRNPIQGFKVRLENIDISARTYTVAIDDYTLFDMQGSTLLDFSSYTPDTFNIPKKNVSIIQPDLDLHAFTSDGRHVGMNYASGIYEQQIPDAVSSGDLIGGVEWIFVPSDVQVTYNVSSHDIGEFLDMYPQHNENFTEQSFDVVYIEFDKQGIKEESQPETFVISSNSSIDITPSPPSSSQNSGNIFIAIGVVCSLIAIVASYSVKKRKK